MDQIRPKKKKKYFKCFKLNKIMNHLTELKATSSLFFSHSLPLSDHKRKNVDVEMPMTKEFYFVNINWESQRLNRDRNENNNNNKDHSSMRNLFIQLIIK